MSEKRWRDWLRMKPEHTADFPHASNIVSPWLPLSASPEAPEEESARLCLHCGGVRIYGADGWRSARGRGGHLPVRGPKAQHREDAEVISIRIERHSLKEEGHPPDLRLYADLLLPGWWDGPDRKVWDLTVFLVDELGRSARTYVEGAQLDDLGDHTWRLSFWAPEWPVHFVELFLYPSMVEADQQQQRRAREDARRSGEGSPRRRSP